MTAQRRRVTTRTASSLKFEDAHHTVRYVRFSWRFNTWQIRITDGTFRNVKAPMARAYAAAGLHIHVDDPRSGVQQMEMFA